MNRVKKGRKPLFTKAKVLQILVPLEKYKNLQRIAKHVSLIESRKISVSEIGRRVITGELSLLEDYAKKNNKEGEN